MRRSRSLWTVQICVTLIGMCWMAVGICQTALLASQKHLGEASSFQKGQSDNPPAAKAPKNPLWGWWQAQDGSFIRFEPDWVTVFDQPKRLRFFYHAEYQDRGHEPKQSSVQLRSCRDGAKSSVDLRLQGEVLTLDPGSILPPSPFHKLQEAPPYLALQPLKLGEAKPLPREKVRAIKKELVRRFHADQGVRNGPDKKGMGRIDRDNQAYLIELIQEVGWIDAQRFGQHAALAAMMIVHHSTNVPLRAAAMARFARDIASGRLGGPAMMLYSLSQARLDGFRKAEQTKLQEKGKKEVQAIFDRAIQTHGGAEKLAAIQAEKTKSRGSSARTLQIHELLHKVSPKGIEVDEREFTRETWYLSPDRLKVETTWDVFLGLNHFHTVVILNQDQGAKKFSGSVQGSNPLRGKWLAVVKEQVHRKRLQRLVGLQDKPYRLLLLGEEKLAGQAAVGVRVQMSGFQDVELFFNQQTGLLVMIRYREADPDSGKEYTVEERVTEYQKVDGISVPKKIVIYQDGEEVEEEEFTEIRLLKTLDEKEFAFPPGMMPLPRDTAVSLPAAAQVAIRAVEKLGGRITRDEEVEGRPIIRVNLHGTKATDEILKSIKELNRLQALELGDTQVTDAGLKELRGLKRLRTLNLSGCTRVTDAGLKELRGLRLQTLFLGKTKVTDAGLKELQGMKGLQTLGLSHTSVTDAGIEELLELKELRRLVLRETRVTKIGAADLEKDLPGLKIER